VIERFERDRDLLAHRVLRRRTSRDQRQGDDALPEHRRIEDVRASAIARPGQQLLAERADRDHRELEVVEVRAEPQQQVRAEDDRQRAVAEAERLAARPRHQRVERIQVEHLRDDQRRLGDHARRRMRPVGVDRPLHQRLHVVRPHDVALDHVRPTARATTHPQHGGPQQDERRDSDERPLQSFVRGDGLAGEEREQQRADDPRHQRNAEHPRALEHAGRLRGRRRRCRGRHVHLEVKTAERAEGRGRTAKPSPQRRSERCRDFVAPPRRSPRSRVVRRGGATAIDVSTPARTARNMFQAHRSGRPGRSARDRRQGCSGSSPSSLP
jgi:hypothetical protein